jgi:hypothetical protein
MKERVLVFLAFAALAIVSGVYFVNMGEPDITPSVMLGIFAVSSLFGD